jgi:hypothetical protein
LGFSGLPPRSSSISPKEVTLYLLLTNAYQLGSFGWEQRVWITHKYCTLVPGNDVWLTSEISTKDINTLAASVVIATGILNSIKMSYRFAAIVQSYMCFPAVYASLHDGCTPLCEVYSVEAGLYMTSRELFLLHNSIHGWADSENMSYADHAWLPQGFVLMCLIDYTLLPIKPPPMAYWSVTRSKFRDPDLSILTKGEVLLPNHKDMLQMLIAWSSCSLCALA